MNTVYSQSINDVEKQIKNTLDVFGKLNCTIYYDINLSWKTEEIPKYINDIISEISTAYPETICNYSDTHNKKITLSILIPENYSDIIIFLNNTKEKYSEFLKNNTD